MFWEGHGNISPDPFGRELGQGPGLCHGGSSFKGPVHGVCRISKNKGGGD